MRRTLAFPNTAAYVPRSTAFIGAENLRIFFRHGAVIPAMTWLKQASLLLLLAGVAVAGLAVAFWLLRPDFRAC